MGLLTKLPRWATGITAGITEPLETQKDVGWVASQKPPAQYLNWLLKTIYDACVVLDGLENTARTWAAVHTFNAKITANGGQDVKGNISLIDTLAQTLLKTAAGGLKIGTAALGGDFELQAAGVTLLKLLASGALQAFTTLSATGSGAGAGVSGTGGATSGSGISGTGGAPNGSGVDGTGTGTGFGVVGTGGSSNSAGVVGYGGGASGSGVYGTGAAGGGHGGIFTLANLTTPVVGNIRLVPLSATPSGPTDGDLWVENVAGIWHLKVRMNSVTSTIV